MIELCGGKASEIVLAGEIPESNRVIDFPLHEPKRLAGLEPQAGEAKRILTSLGFIVSGNTEIVKVAVPSWRADVEGKADLVGGNRADRQA